MHSLVIQKYVSVQTMNAFSNAYHGKSRSDASGQKGGENDQISLSPVVSESVRKLLHGFGEVLLE